MRSDMDKVEVLFMSVIDRLRCPVNFEFPGHVETFWQFPYYLLVIWMRLAERVTCFWEDLCCQIPDGESGFPVTVLQGQRVTDCCQRVGMAGSSTE